MELLILVTLLAAILFYRQWTSSDDDVQPKRRASSHALGPVMLGESLHLGDRTPTAGAAPVGRTLMDPTDGEQSLDYEDDYLFGETRALPVSFGYPCDLLPDPYDMDPTNPLSPMYLDQPEIGFDDDAAIC
ncbi:MAG: hypothetical protein HYV17_04685 [Xanthomonadales bacterium]|nr:hypothetical protein [Xanthomonadales bacterium]